MTNLTKPVKRVSQRARVREAGKLRDIVVIVRPNGTIGFRAAGCKTEYALPITRLYYLAVEAHVQDKKKQKAKERKLKKRKGRK